MISNLRVATVLAGLVPGTIVDLLDMRFDRVAPLSNGVGLSSTTSPAGVGGTGGALFDLKTLSSPMSSVTRRLPADGQQSPRSRDEVC